MGKPSDYDGRVPEPPYTDSAEALSADLERVQTELDAAVAAAKTALCVLSAIKGDDAYKPHPNMAKDIDIAIDGLRAVTA